MEDFLKISNLTKRYKDRIVLNGIDFTVGQGEFVSILGPSGCGKTTLLNLLIGILKPDSGKIFKNGEDITNFKPSDRKMGIVFQNYALFPSMTVLRNVEYALSIRKETRACARDIAMDLLDKVGLSEHLYKKPAKLSGGQQQRVAIARTLALSPDIILFDEPMSALDVTTRLMMRDEIKRIQKDTNITIIFITHDQEEAFSMSDRIIVMGENSGNIEQYDTPATIAKYPATAYVENFVVKQIEKKIETLSHFVEVKHDCAN